MNTDPLGKALLAYLDGQEEAAIVLHSSLDGIDKMDVVTFFRSFDEMPKVEQGALLLAYGKILDVGAGAGCHSILLQNNHQDVWGLDVSKGAVETMKQMGIKQTIQSNFYDYEAGSFDTILFLMNGIGLFGAIEELPKLLNHCKKLLSPNGQILFDSSDIINAYQESDGSFRISLTDDYYGTVSYQMEFEGEIGPSFKWTYIDSALMYELATKSGFDMEVLIEGPNNDYLAKLTLSVVNQ